MLKTIRFTITVSLLIAILSVFQSHDAEAQLAFSSPATDTRIKSCDDFATQVLHDPWDMSNSSDINRFFPGTDINNVNSPTVSGGIFSGNCATTGSAFYLLSPQACGSYPVGGRWGQNNIINAPKYRNLSFRMFVDKVDPFGFRMIWDRSCNYAATRSVTSSYPTKLGWNTYSVDMINDITIDGGNSTSNAGWGTGSIFGFALLPSTQSGANFQVDWIRLEDPSTCQTTSSGYTATTQGNNDLYSVWLDDDNNPFNGYLKQLKNSVAATGADTVSISSLAVQPGAYWVTGILDSDYRTLELADPWDMNSDSDLLVSAGVTGETMTGGAYSGQVISNDPNVYLRLAGSSIPAAKYNKITLKMSSSGGGGALPALFWNGGFYLFTGGDKSGDYYTKDLSGVGGWTGDITELIVRPAVNGIGTTFSIDFVSLRKSGFDTTRDSSTLNSDIKVAAGRVLVNTPPVVSIDEPNIKGGVAVRPWNMKETSDLVIFDNLISGQDATYPAESYTAFLPDVRTVDGLRGDFFKGTNVAGSDDPINYSTFPFGVPSPITFNSAEYRNLCFKLFIDRPFDLGAGSVARVLWKAENQDFETSEDLVLIYRGWTSSRWQEYCLDLAKLHLDMTDQTSWDGNIHAFRVDSHEFNVQTSYYFDYIKVRKDDTSYGKFNIHYNLIDPDDSATVSLYYSSSETTSGGTFIATLPESQRSYVWDTTGVPNGTYYIYAVADDGINSTTRLATGRLVINNGGGTTDNAPVLSVQAPASGDVICSDIQIKGYALHTDRFEDVASVEVYLDSVLFTVIKPDLYSPQAVAAYPNADSSNTGFNFVTDFSSVAAGAHTVQIKALSTDGGVAMQSIPITKSNVGCASLVVDSSPAGSPVTPSLGATATPTPPPSLTAPLIKKVGLNTAGTFSMTVQVNGTNSGSCTLTPRVGAKPSPKTNLKSYTIANGKTTAVFTASKVYAGAKLPFHIDVVKSCGGLTATSTSKKVTPKSRTVKLKKINKLVSKLKSATKIK